MNFPDIPVYVVSVKTFTERHDHIRRLAQLHSFSFEFVFDYDADELSDNDWRRIGRSMSPQCASTVLKHIECQKRLCQTDCNMALVLEDDVLLFRGFVESVSQIVAATQKLRPGWLVFLGGADNKLDDRFFDSKKLELIDHPISTAEAYLIDRVGAEARLAYLEGKKIDLPADHQLRAIDEYLGISQFWSSEPLATQGSITGLFKTSLDKSRAKHSLLFLAIKFQWNRWRRQVLPKLLRRIFD